MIEQLSQALGVTRMELDRRGVQTDDVEQRLVRIASPADVRDFRSEDVPVRLDRPKDGKQPAEVVEAARFAQLEASVEPRDARERGRRQDPVRLGADPNGGNRASPADETLEELLRRARSFRRRTAASASSP